MVAAIIEIDELDESAEDFVSLDPFIAVASSMTDRIRDAAVANNLLRDGVESGDPTRYEKLTNIETWLAAHFYATRFSRAKQEQAGQVGVTYESDTDLMLLNSKYGQVAIMLDETGTLKGISDGIGLPVTATIKWGGTRSCVLSDVV